MCPPLGAVAVLVFALPKAPASQPLSVAAGFLFGSIAVYSIYTVVGENFLKDFGGTRALLVGGAIAAMKVTDTVHPPVAVSLGTNALKAKISGASKGKKA
jgi:CBS-domain-containing membrane protein